MRFTPLYAFIVTSVVSAAAIGASGASFFIVSRNIQTSRDNLQEMAGEIMSMNADHSRILSLSELFKQRADDISRLNNLSVNKQRPLDFIERIESIAHITNSTLALGADEVKGDPTTLLFRVAADGNEIGLRNFIKLIEALPYQISIENVSFQRDMNTPVQGKPNAHLILALKVKAQ